MIMLDLETMGTKPDAAIVAIGAVSFDNEKIIDKFYCEVSLKSSVEMGASICTDTVIWWMGQSLEARRLFDDNNNAKDIIEALISFEKWYTENKKFGNEVWGNGAAFDNVVLNSAYRLAGIKAPWPFWADMCYRTIKNLNQCVPFFRVGTHHNALDDAESQALHLIEIFKKGQ